jgi:hypothetical protein
VDIVTTFFIDVSHHDWDRNGGPIDWAAVAAAGMGSVVCARASYGDPIGFNPPSPRFGETMIATAAAGFTARGGYHNLIKGGPGSINRQVDLLRSTLDKFGAEWAMADVESYDELVHRDLVPNWSDVQRFHDRWYAVESRVMGWYIARWKWQAMGSPNLTGLRGPLLNAQYPGGSGTPQSIYRAGGGDHGDGWVPFGGRTPDCWQFTASAKVRGKAGTTDANAFRGTTADLVAMLTGGSVQASMSGDDEMDKTQAKMLADIAWSVARGVPTAAGKASQAITFWAAGVNAALAAIAAKVDIDPGELAQIQAAAQQGAHEGVVDAADEFLAKLVPHLPTGSMTRAEVEQAVRDAFAGGLAPDTRP